MYNDILLFDNVGYTTGDCHANKIPNRLSFIMNTEGVTMLPQSDITPGICFKGFFHLHKFEWETYILCQNPGTCQFPGHGDEFMLIPSIEIKSNLSDEFNFNSLMIEFIVAFFYCHNNLKCFRS